MRVELNLATRPTENRRRFYVLAGGAVAVLLLLAVLQAAAFLRNWSSGRDFDQRAAALRSEIARLQSEQKELEQDLQQPQARDVLDRSYFLNSLIYQKSVSWTEIFMDLEKLLPDRVQITSIHPEVVENNQVRLDMIVTGETMAQAVEFVQRVEKSGRFGSPLVSQETPPARDAKDNSVKLAMSVLYAQK